MAAPFEVLQDAQFSLIILDECSQLTEPTSLLSIAKFQCKRLVRGISVGARTTWHPDVIRKFYVGYLSSLLMRLC
jgi:hypothetical protein